MGSDITADMSVTDQSYDVEKDGSSDYAHLENDAVKSFSWNNITVTLKPHPSSRRNHILSNVSGWVESGEVLALMGPR